MFSFLKGTVTGKTPHELLISVNGLGFAVQVPIEVLSQAKEGEEIFLWLRSFFREKEKDFVHYGFRTKEELRLFNLLLKVPSVGPQVAMSIISHLGCAKLTETIEKADTQTLGSVPRVGPKTAKRIITELSKEIQPETAESRHREVVEALMSLGYTREEASEALASIQIEKDDSTEDILKKALKRLGAGR